ncbi:MAG: phospholipid carrier-dependent glycosyltransferase, partial [Cyanobacteria bacterium P01_H01_bin.15]
AKSLNPIGFHRPYLGEPWPLPAAIAEIVKSDPLQQNTLGVLPSTPTINQHNVSFYGAQADFRVFGRQVGTQAAMLDQDLRSLDWFLLKTGDQGSIPEAQSEMVELVRTSPEFAQHWQTALPDGSELQLYHRRRPSVTVEPVSTEHSLRLEILDLPTQARPGQPVPVTYRWLGPAETLANGLVLLDWRPITESGQTENSSPAWIHDHGFGMGYLRSQTLSSTNQSELATWRVIERTAMLPPPNLSGSFQLTARYLDSQSGETHSIPVPANSLALSSDSPQSSAPELDLGTQLRQLAPNMAEGDASLDRIFTEIGRINQYDPTQDYLRQLIQTLQFRLRSQPNPDWLYAVTLAQVLRQDPLGAIATLTQLAELSPENPFVYAYLSFLYLYNWQPRQAQDALLPAEQLAPELEIIQILGGASRLLQGNVIGAWKRLQPLLSPGSAN